MIWWERLWRVERFNLRQIKDRITSENACQKPAGNGRRLKTKRIPVAKLTTYSLKTNCYCKNWCISSKHQSNAISYQWYSVRNSGTSHIEKSAQISCLTLDNYIHRMYLVESRALSELTRIRKFCRSTHHLNQQLNIYGLYVTECAALKSSYTAS